MKKILNNGLTIVAKESACQNLEVSVTFKGGHGNESKLGLAAVYENIVQQGAKCLSSIFGGSLTSFVTGSSVEKLPQTLENLYKWCVTPEVNAETLSKAIADIVQHTRDLAPLPKRQAKLAYKHTAFGNNKVFWNTEDYIDKVSELTVADVADYIVNNFVGRNVVIGFCGPKKCFEEVIAVADKLFGSLPKGKRHDIDLQYTGGFQRIEGNGKMQIALFGWDISKDNSTADTNVLMSMLSGRLERSLAEAGLAAEAEVKIAGYFGLRTLRIAVFCPSTDDFQSCIDVVCANVKRLKKSKASDRRMETSKQKAMVERLAISNEALPRSVEIAWALLGRGIDYDADNAIANIWDVSARDVKDAAEEIFSKKMTCVLYTNATCDGAKDIEAKMA